MGMGLLLKNKKHKATTSSEQALKHLEEIHENWEEVTQDSTLDDAQLASESLNLLEDEVAVVHDMLQQGDHLLAFRTLEAIDLFLEEEDGMTWTGVEDSARSSMVYLLFSAWVTVVLQLLQQPRESRPENFKHVLKRAGTTGEELGSMCEQGANIGKALDFLQALASAQEEEEEEQEGNDEQQGGKRMDLVGNQADLSKEFDFFDQYQAYARKAQGRTSCKGENSAGQDEDEEGLFEDEEEGDEGENMGSVFEGQLIEAAMLRDLLKDRQPSGRLTALDDVKLRPLLMRVASRLPPKHSLRTEVSEALGSAWEEALSAAASGAADDLSPTISGGSQQAGVHGSGKSQAGSFPGFAPRAAAGSRQTTASVPHPGGVAVAHAAAGEVDSPTNAAMRRDLDTSGNPSRLRAFGSEISVPPGASTLQQLPDVSTYPGLLAGQSPQPSPFPRSLPGGDYLQDAMAKDEGFLRGEGERSLPGGLDELLDSEIGGSLLGEPDEQPSKMARLR